MAEEEEGEIIGMVFVVFLYTEEALGRSRGSGLRGIDPTGSKEVWLSRMLEVSMHASMIFKDLNREKS